MLDEDINTHTLFTEGEYKVEAIHVPSGISVCAKNIDHSIAKTNAIGLLKLEYIEQAS